jgi:alpha-ribazole phosphatase
MTRMCLVRHGETEWNLEGRYQGQNDIPLNEKGRDQARAAALLLQGQPFIAIYASDLKRAMETAEIIKEMVHLPITPDARLREIDQGEWEGQLVEVIKQRYAELWQQRTVDPASLRAPGGETVRDVASRVYAALDDIARTHPDGPVLIVSHGLAIATVICKVRKVPIEQVYSVIPENAEPLWVEWGDSVKENM